MGKITLVCTVHRARGFCNENELIRILESIGPDLIFEEIRPSDFESLYRDKSKHTLEMRAVCRYLSARPAQQVPVDDFVIPESFPGDIDSLFEYAESNSNEYCALMVERDQKTHQLGFWYLNSPEFELLSKRARELFERTIIMPGSGDLKKILLRWNALLGRREASMVKNIYDFCRNSPFTQGVFLVGAGHMPSIIEHIESHIKTENNHLDWNIGNLPS